ncbi:MAG: NAD-dependent epimerase/dehydratase family protein [Novosphingobium sp.]|nr:NAD-dependent epimerase/dehydratase family protein [Novosphingobium sp.]
MQAVRNGAGSCRRLVGQRSDERPTFTAGVIELRLLVIGGTGEISFACVAEAARAGHQVTVFNRGHTSEALPSGVEQTVGDRRDYLALTELASKNFDVVCQFLAFDVPDAAADITTFKGRCGQFVFVSSASVYRRPVLQLPVNETSPVGNRFSPYAEAKLRCETVYRQAHDEGLIPVTIIRPSHTYRHRLPSTIVSGDHLAWRLLRGKPVAVHGDGQSLWTLTHADDFARAFVALCGLGGAVGQTLNITDSTGHTWNEILTNVATAIGVTPDIRAIPTLPLETAIPDLEPTLSGDKASSLIFEQSNLKSLVNGWQCDIPLELGIRSAWNFASKRLADGFHPDALFDSKIDKLIEQSGVHR